MMVPCAIVGDPDGVSAQRRWAMILSAIGEGMMMSQQGRGRQEGSGELLR